MDYKKHYDLLIERAITRLLEGYGEKHHIVPRCMGGTDDTTNIVVLTAEEHYVAHQLLIKIYPKHRGLAEAAYLMTVDGAGNRVNNKMYGWLKRKISEERSERMKGKKLRLGMSPSAEHRAKISATLKGRPSPHKGIKHSAESKKNMSEGSKGQRPWNKGKTGYTMPAASDERKRKISEGVKRNWIKRKEAAKCSAT